MQRDCNYKVLKPSSDPVHLKLRKAYANPCDDATIQDFGPENYQSALGPLQSTSHLVFCHSDQDSNWPCSALRWRCTRRTGCPTLIFLCKLPFAQIWHVQLCKVRET